MDSSNEPFKALPDTIDDVDHDEYLSTEAKGKTLCPINPFAGPSEKFVHQISPATEAKRQREKQTLVDHLVEWDRDAVYICLVPAPGGCGLSKLLDRVDRGRSIPIASVFHLYTPITVCRARPNNALIRRILRHRELRLVYTQRSGHQHEKENQVPGRPPIQRERTYGQWFLSCRTDTTGMNGDAGTPNHTTRARREQPPGQEYEDNTRMESDNIRLRSENISLKLQFEEVQKSLGIQDTRVAPGMNMDASIRTQGQLPLRQKGAWKIEDIDPDERFHEIKKQRRAQASQQADLA
ncbi:hypothetical protein K469DRAFT_693989 [Zopfia rhizophila CBS 207.26]|uniref:Uncharacterized protein n=1 Tax=Zopfia rhizophila CBS 207.26 TaxID=1314779 RepID=A0A6A6DJ36_9PEZI|nr:hypothetical protein K469DRAFT_693989 [Zopfia rhizophila CBS 207.26]